MKHDLKITIYLVILFITAQVVGLFVVSQKIAPSFDEIGNIKLNNDGVIILEENLESEPPFFTYRKFTLLSIYGTLWYIFIVYFK